MILWLKLFGLKDSVLFPPVFPVGLKPPCPSIVSMAVNWTVHFRDTLFNNFLISQYVAWRIFGGMIESVLSQGDTLPEQFERVLLVFLVFCNLPIDVFKNSSGASAAWHHLHLQRCTAALENFVVCTMLWFSMKGLWITGGRGMEWGVPEHFLDSWEVKWGKLIIQKCKLCMLEKNQGPQTEMLATVAAKRARRDFLQFQPSPGIPVKLALSSPRALISYLVCSWPIISWLNYWWENKPDVAVLKLASPEVRVRLHKEVTAQAHSSAAWLMCSQMGTANTQSGMHC